MNYNELMRKLKKHGCYFVEQKTNHEWWYSPITKKHFPLQRHGTMEVGEHILSSIKRETGVKL